MDKEAIYLKLEAFLDGTLSESEREEVQQQIATDEEVAEQLALLRLERELGALMVDDDLELKMKQWTEDAEDRHRAEGNGQNKNSRGDSPPKKNIGSRIWGILLTLGLLFSAYFLITLPMTDRSHNLEINTPEDPPVSAPGSVSEDLVPSTNNGTGVTDDPSELPEKELPGSSDIKPSTNNSNRPVAGNDSKTPPNIQQLALAEAATISPIESTRTTRSHSDETPDEPPIVKGARLMDAGKLPEAIAVFEAVPVENASEYRNAQQYLAYIFFERDDFERAIPIFKKLIREGYFDMDKMQWYLALAELATGEAKDLSEIRAIAENSGEQEVREAAAAFLKSVEGE